MILKDILRTIKEEGLWHLFLRTLKVISMRMYRFLRSLPYLPMLITKKKVVRDINNYKMYLDLSDKGISRELLIFKKREYYGTDLLCSGELIKQGDTILDIGANIGYFALLESKVVGPSGKIYAVEPSPVNYQRLNENIKLNKCDNIETFNLAIGDKNGQAKMFISSRSNWSRLIERDMPDSINQVVNVDMLTVDDFLKDKQPPDLIRMDVEGYEINILKGMKNTLKKSNLKIFLEFHARTINETDAIEFFDSLINNGFETKHCLLNPSLDQNIFTAFAYKHLGEYDFYKGNHFKMNISEAKQWVLKTKFIKVPHFVFAKGP